MYEEWKTVSTDTIQKIGNSIPDVGSAPDVRILTISALRVVTSDTSVLTRGLLNDTTLAPAIHQALSDCADHFLDEVEQLDDSLAAMMRAYPNVRKCVKTAIADANDCEAGFQQLATGPNLLSHRNLIFRQLCNNALGIVGLLKA
ncbi:uncharacterized protein LOC115750172 [Rhodamnia argentea]|uniref:Uncharacterized protein LOC115750172 n=1 Tax=Rhodamnia argentea TaxID=178133 RepID=A0A8B8Q7X9_9MYRT|nr:uncharacterized protein LOC115750172 [Rhodamnia argentea]